MNPQAAPLLPRTDLVVDYKTTPQQEFNGRSVTNYAGRLLSGSSAANYGCWMRAPAADYDRWAHHVGDPRWTYKNLLPYFRRTEHHHDPNGDHEQHGFDGPIHTTSRRVYPLRNSVHQAFNEAGFHDVPDTAAGMGVTPWVENWRDGSRQHSSKAFDLSGIHIITRINVARVLLNDQKAATGVELADGRQYQAKQEVIISCGAHKTPQLLMLSGIGPADELQEHNIQQLVDSPAVGRNHFDHLSLHQAWKLRHPEQGLAMGSPAFNKPEYSKGFPVEWTANYSVPDSVLQQSPSSSPPLPSDFPSRLHLNLLVAYAPLNLSPDFPVPLDGTHVSTGALLLQPTSRGRITLASNDPSSEPILDANYYSTTTDKALLRSGIRRVADLMRTTAMHKVIECETVPEGMPALSTPTVTDKDIDAHIAAYAQVWHHSAGTAAMGKDREKGAVVDGTFRVHGTNRLRIVDASVLPEPISATPQATVYVLAEVAAELLAQTVL